MKNYFFVLCVSIPLITFSQAKLNNFDFLIGKWQGVESGVAGDGIGYRTYDYELGGNYIFQKNQSTFPKTEKKPKGEVHRDIGVFSYDSVKDQVIFRSFNVEGFTNIYVLDKKLSDENRYVFITREIENNPGNWKARLTIEIINNEEFTEAFDIATDGENFSSFLRNHWYKIK
ncbi:MAG: hypothetical protein R3214_06345 [Christiangramia sp.]|nr:hypothetical protein [Christiangramia sp.]